MSFEYAIIVKNKTRLEVLIERFNTKAQAKFYIEKLGGNFEDYVLEHEIFHAALLTLQTKLSKVLKNKIIERSFLPSFIFNKKQLIIVLGQDGLVANTAKYSQAQPIIAVNPDIKRYDGVLLPFTSENFIYGVEKVLLNKHKYKVVRMAEARLNDGQRLLAFNDLFIGINSHVSARYTIAYNKKQEEHSSSGIIISTKAGATGWLSSVFNMAFGITSTFEISSKLKYPKIKDNELIFCVREPFKSIKTQIGISSGVLNESNKLVVESLMPSNGIIFSDGIESDFLQFNSGTIASVGIASETATLVL